MSDNPELLSQIERTRRLISGPLDAMTRDRLQGYLADLQQKLEAPEPAAADPDDEHQSPS
jgi:hypothetical protein